MSFESLKKDELLELADKYGVDVKASDTKAVILAAFVEDGVTWEDTVKQDDVVAEKDLELKAEAEEARIAEDTVLLKMTRANYVYEIRGYSFAKAHPFGLVAESDAEYIVENDEGFRYATPKEAAEFYG